MMFLSCAISCWALLIVGSIVISDAVRELRVLVEYRSSVVNLREGSHGRRARW